MAPVARVETGELPQHDNHSGPAGDGGKRLDPRAIIAKIAAADGLDGIAGPVASFAGRATSPKAVKNALSGTWLGHQLHPLLTDVTIGAWLSASAVDVFGGSAGAGAARGLTGLGILSAVPTAASGMSDWAETYGPDQRVGLVHAGANTVGLALQIGSYVARGRGNRGLGGALSLTALGITAAAGYLGGHLVYSRGVGVSHTAFEHRSDDWTDVGGADALEQDQPLRVDAGGVPVVVVQTGDGLFALSATCTHAGGPLDEGELVDGCLKCPWHQSMFRLSDGGVERGPAAEPQPSWQARIAEGRLQVRAAD
jgi:nitrite reductase/ring-hydroxylating ferredoxin subunit/uncharacterized membrane protein